MGNRWDDDGEAHPAWGAMLLGDGTARFRLWAPAEQNVAVVLDGRDHPMARREDGWFETVAPALVGQTYSYRLKDGTRIADPASAAQAGGIDEPSIIVDHRAFAWRATTWRGRPWEEAVIYEIHVGTFTQEGTFRAAIERLAHLAELGVTAIEIMPVAQFAGARGWGYDGVLLYAPHSVYGTPDDLKHLVDAAHGHGLMVFLDVVYNHFGTVGNNLSRVAPAFFHPDRHTPWGAAIAFEQPAVRSFFLDNATMWIADYRFDGLRFDAADQIVDDSASPFILEMAKDLRLRFPDRQLHLVVEDADDRRHLVETSAEGRPRLYTAGWNDDLHHALHVIATGETTGHYEAFAKDPWRALAVATAGFSAGPPAEPASKPPAGLPPQVHVNFLQNHDQAGNRAFGERLIALADRRLLEVMTAMLILTPQVPLLFMGEDYGETNPFHFFADLDGEVGEAVREGRKREAENFGGIRGQRSSADLPDPLAAVTFERSKLDWSRLAAPEGENYTARLRHLIDLRRSHILPLLQSGEPVRAHSLPGEEGVLAVDWKWSSARLSLRANLTRAERQCPPLAGRLIHASDGLQTSAATVLGGPAIAVSVDRGTAGSGQAAERSGDNAV